MVLVKYKQEEDRWVKGDRWVRPLIRKIVRGKPLRRSGMEKVVDNFLIGLNRLKVPYKFNDISFFSKKNDKVISFGLGLKGLEGIQKQQPVIAAIGFPHPIEIPDLCEKYNIKKFLQHSQWVVNLARSAKIYDDSIFDLWQAGIDTDHWKPLDHNGKKTDILIYNKIYWDKEKTIDGVLQPLKDYLVANNYSFEEIKYGNYFNPEFKEKLDRCKAMIFLSAGESQGIAYQECLATNVPVFAWDQGFWLDPARFKYNTPVVPCSSVPFFDERCGMKFKDLEEFKLKFEFFFDSVRSGKFSPRNFIMENLTIEKSTLKLLSIYNSI